MTDCLEHLEPRLVWKHFAALSAIPRPSKQEGRVRQYVMDQAAQWRCSTSLDGVGNLLVRKPGSPGREGEPILVLQGHLDMVGEKNEGVDHDFAQDPLQLWRDGDWLRARGTTLGADNGIGCAAALAALEDTSLSHPPLECLFTIDEETGLTGANQLQPGWLQGRRLLNLDTEEEGILYIGCAGGLDSDLTLRVTRIPANAGWVPQRLKVEGSRVAIPGWTFTGNGVTQSRSWPASWKSCAPSSAFKSDPWMAATSATPSPGKRGRCCTWILANWRRSGPGWSNGNST